MNNYYITVPLSFVTGGFMNLKKNIQSFEKRL